MQFEELPRLDICGFSLLRCSGYYTSRVSYNGQGVGVDGSDLVQTIQLTSQTYLPYATKVFSGG